MLVVFNIYCRRSEEGIMKKPTSVGGGAALAVAPVRNILWLSWKIVTGISITLCVLAFLRLQNYDQKYPYTASSDSESSLSSSSSSSSSLIHHRSRSVSSYVFEGNAKIAFLFLARRNLPLDFLWGSFFEVSLISTSSFNLNFFESSFRFLSSIM